MRHKPAPSSAIGEDCEEGKGENQCKHTNSKCMWASKERDGGIGNTEIFIELVSHNARH